MWDDLKDAVHANLIIGVGWFVRLLVILVGLSWWMGDYWTIRQQAAHGEQAFQFLAKQPSLPSPPPRAPQSAPKE